MKKKNIATWGISVSTLILAVIALLTYLNDTGSDGSTRTSIGEIVMNGGVLTINSNKFVVQDVMKDERGRLRHLALDEVKSGMEGDIAIMADELPAERLEKRATLSDVKKEAERYGLMRPRIENPGLRFKTGDLAYWTEQGLQLWELQLEFYARKLVLDAADKHGAEIPTQGDLSHFAQRIYGKLYRTARIRWGAG
uniref:Uncharacterized protein n=1 Tax=Candidatus Kentrum eta TaxID=2126337 RepID=A0A450UG60_9GAMM|nr:MAG: hypothetical protein BECKH772B_GA0070898_1001832 [Candidatus Kentron sp. H]VFK03611.1 MAG: hypothetical protein BECKH772A_GA0070896_103393 [Candidatus Kentron sp. H]VFK06214.1 MAG: hypothetical protein BECKH772C_GA0070978_103343 [Candidatus Kentron sp. H]